METGGSEGGMRNILSGKSLKNALIFQNDNKKGEGALPTAPLVQGYTKANA